MFDLLLSTTCPLTIDAGGRLSLSREGVFLSEAQCECIKVLGPKVETRIQCDGTKGTQGVEDATLPDRDIRCALLGPT
jgi:hypothetical protein